MKEFHSFIRHLKQCQLTNTIKFNVGKLVLIPSKFVTGRYYFQTV